jgi:hypothetical protein
MASGRITPVTRYCFITARHFHIHLIDVTLWLAYSYFYNTI